MPTGRHGHPSDHHEDLEICSIDGSEQAETVVGGAIRFVDPLKTALEYTLRPELLVSV